MSDSNTTIEWKEWLEDWQFTITPEGRLTPVLPCLGNHEEVPTTLINLFDVAAPNLYYALNFGGNLIRIYTLNSFAAPGGDQKQWLKKDLENNTSALFKVAQYHLPIRPHTNGKESNQEEYMHWTPLFGKYEVKLAIECDAHVVKYTYPIRPSTTPDAVEGFVRDDNFGTVYIGEGGWGAPLRKANRNRNWTRNSDAFNQFHWIWVDKNKIEVRTIKIDCVEKVIASPTKNPFEIPQNLDIWKPSKGDIVTITRGNSTTSPPIVAEVEEGFSVENLPKLNAEHGSLELNFTLPEASEVKVKVLNLKLNEVLTIDIPKQPAGKNTEIIRFDKVPPGRYIIVLRAQHKVLGRYLVVKKQ
jgi:acid phosphatase type 7